MIGAHSAMFAPATRMTCAFGNVAPGIGAAIDAENFFGGRACRDHAEASVVVDVGGLQRDPRELAHQVSFFVGQRGTGQQGECVIAILLLNAAGSR